MKNMWKELGQIALGYDGTDVTNTVLFIIIDEIKWIPKDCIVTYAQVAVDCCPQKADPNHVWITVGGNMIDYPGKLTTRNCRSFNIKNFVEQHP